MNYKYIISGQYKDWVKINKNDVILHDGSLIGLLSNDNCGNLELSLNYGKINYFNLVIKKLSNYFVAIPKMPDCLFNNYIYRPLIYTKAEFSELINNSYIDEVLIENISTATKEDVIKMWIYTFDKRISSSNYSELKDNIINAIIAFSDYDADIFEFLDSVFKSTEINVFIIKKNYQLITVYLDIKREMCEWDSIIKIDDKFYLKLDDTYMVGVR